MSAMTTTTDVTPARVAAGTPRPRLLTGPLAVVLLFSLGSAVSFYLLLSVMPLYAASVGAGGAGAGMVTGALMLSTAVAELVTPRLVARFGYRLALGGGMVLLGAPALALPASTSVAAITAVCLVRGAGLAVLFVAGGALTAALLPDDRRGEGLGLMGVVVGVPAIVALPLGMWLARQVGYPPVFVAGALAALAPLALVRGLPRRAPAAAAAGEGLGMLAGLRSPALVRPAVVFAATAMAAGAVVTFLPAAVSRASGDLAAVALLVQAATASLSRWWAGRYGDRHGAARLLPPAALLAALGLLGLVFPASPAAVVVGMALFGAGFGVAQNASLALMFQRAPAAAYDTVSAVWSLAYDGGMGLGAAGFGLVATVTGDPAAFGLTACVVVAALALARRRRG